MSEQYLLVGTKGRYYDPTIYTGIAGKGIFGMSSNNTIVKVDEYHGQVPLLVTNETVYSNDVPDNTWYVGVNGSSYNTKYYGVLDDTIFMYRDNKVVPLTKVHSVRTGRKHV